MRAQAEEAGLHSIALPRLAAGLGGLDWERVLALIENCFRDWEGELLVYSLE